MRNLDTPNDELALSVKNQIVAGNQHAFRQLFNTYSTRLVEFASALVRNKEAATDVVNEVFVKLWKGRDRIPGIQNLKVYLYTATKNAALNYLSHKAHQLITEPFDDFSIQLREEQCPDQQLITEEIFNKIRMAIEALPPRCKMIFKLVREDGLRYKEVAEVLNVSVKTVDAQMVIAVRKIGEKVKSEFEFFPGLAAKKSAVRSPQSAEDNRQ